MDRLYINLHEISYVKFMDNEVEINFKNGKSKIIVFQSKDKALRAYQTLIQTIDSGDYKYCEISQPKTTL